LVYYLHRKRSRNIGKAREGRKKEKADLDDEERIQKQIENRVKKAKTASDLRKVPEFTELKRDDTKIEFSLNPYASLELGEEGEPSKPFKFNWNDQEDDTVEEQQDPKNDSVSVKRKASALDDIMLEEEMKKDRLNRKEFWLAEEIVVKVMNSDLADGKYYKDKGVVKKVFDNYIGLVRMIDSGDVLKLDQSQLETVIPNIGGSLKVVNGAYRGETATLISIDADAFCVQIKLETGSRMGNIVSAEYEDICKLNVKKTEVPK